MGSAQRPRPQQLAGKLLEIRNKLGGGLSQNELIKRLGLEGLIEQERVSKYERDILEPPLFVLCAYADAANIYLEVIVKDELDLPEDLPSQRKSMGIKKPIP